MKRTYLVLILCLMQVFSAAQNYEIKLYPAGIPPDLISEALLPITQTEISELGTDGILRVWHVTQPSISVFLPDPAKQTGKAVLICPGGGYGILALGHEGYDVAKALAEQGITGIVLKYRMPDAKLFKNSHLSPLLDAQKALLIIKEHAEIWKINADQIGVMGFSAGGHLAACLATLPNILPLENNQTNHNLKPAFAVLIYPVISTNQNITHNGSIRNLLGAVDDTYWRNYFSLEKQINSTTPSCFLIHSGDDQTVPVSNSLLFYESLIRNNIAAEMHIFAKGGHGFGLNNKSTQTAWLDLCINWISEVKESNKETKILNN